MPSQLLVKFPSSKQWPGWHFQQYLLTNIDLKPPTSPSPPPSTAPTNTSTTTTASTTTSSAPTQPKLLTITIEPKTHADYLADASVFTGYTHDPDTGAVTNTYALKFAFRQDLIASLASEGTVYTNYLGSVQGSVVPRCEGLFLGSPLPVVPQTRAESTASASGRKVDRYVEEDIEEEDKGMAACLVLEWWGKSVTKPFHRLPLQTRFLITDHLATFHKLGLYHGDFAERNVLISKKPRSKSKSESKSGSGDSGPLPTVHPIPTTLPALSYSSSSSCSTSSTASVPTPASEKPTEDAYFASGQTTKTTSPVPDAHLMQRVAATEDQGEREEDEFDVRLIDFDLVMKHECRACGRDFRIPFVPLPEQDLPASGAADDRLPDDVKKLQIDDGDDDEEDEEEMSKEAKAFGCDQLYEVAKYTMRLWD